MMDDGDDDDDDDGDDGDDDWLGVQVCILNCPTAPSQEREVVQWRAQELKHIGDDDDDDIDEDWRW